MGSLAVLRPFTSSNYSWQSTSPIFSLPSVSQNLYRIKTRVPDFKIPNTRHHQLNCYHNQNETSSSMDNEHQPHQEALLKAILGISKAESRTGRKTTMVLGGTVNDDSPYEGISVNKMLNIYPAARGFTAIGSGGDDFVQSMVVAVESVVQHPIPQGKVKQKLSSGGKYVSVNIGPVQIVSSKQVQAVYYAMKRDDRMRYFL